MSILSENFGDAETSRIAKRVKRIDQLVQKIIDSDRRIVTHHGDLTVSTVTMNFNYKFEYNGSVMAHTFHHTIKIHPRPRTNGLAEYIRKSLTQIIEITYQAQGNRNIIPGSIVPQPSVSVSYDKYNSDALKHYSELESKKHNICQYSKLEITN